LKHLFTFNISANTAITYWYKRASVNMWIEYFYGTIMRHRSIDHTLTRNQLSLRQF